MVSKLVILKRIPLLLLLLLLLLLTVTLSPAHPFVNVSHEYEDDEGPRLQKKKIWSPESAKRLRDELNFLEETSFVQNAHRKQEEQMIPEGQDGHHGHEWSEDQINLSQSGLMKPGASGSNSGDLDDQIDLNEIERKIGPSLLSESSSESSLPVGPLQEENKSSSSIKNKRQRKRFKN